MVRETRSGTRLEPVGPAFLEAFLPRELQLIQRRILGRPGGAPDPAAQLGLYLLRIDPLPGGSFPAEAEGGAEIRRTLLERLGLALRFSDVAATLSDRELLGVARDLDGEQAFQVAQRILAGTVRGELLQAAGLGVRLAYVVYPLSTQPDLDPCEWRLLVDLARSLLARDGRGGLPAGHGLLKAQGSPPNIPEGDLVRLAFQDLETLTGSGILRLQRIHLLPG